jgi:hypothetical protein
MLVMVDASNLLSIVGGAKCVPFLTHNSASLRSIQSGLLVEKILSVLREFWNTPYYVRRKAMYKMTLLFIHALEEVMDSFVFAYLTSATGAAV